MTITSYNFALIINMYITTTDLSPFIAAAELSAITETTGDTTNNE